VQLLDYTNIVKYPPSLLLTAYLHTARSLLWPVALAPCSWGDVGGCACDELVGLREVRGEGPTQVLVAHLD